MAEVLRPRRRCPSSCRSTTAPAPSASWSAPCARLDIEGGLEIVLVVDGSPDNSLDVCKQLAAEPGAPVTVLSLSRNFGEHNAVMAGLARARGAFAITMDDDLQNPPGEVKRLFEHARDGGYDAVYTYYAEKKHAAWRNLGSRFTNWCADRLIDKPHGPLSLELPLHLAPSCASASRRATKDPIPMSTG